MIPFLEAFWHIIFHGAIWYIGICGLIGFGGALIVEINNWLKYWAEKRERIEL